MRPAPGWAPAEAGACRGLRGEPHVSGSPLQVLPCAPGGFSLHPCLSHPRALRLLPGFGHCEAAAGTRGSRSELVVSASLPAVASPDATPFSRYPWSYQAPCRCLSQGARHPLSDSPAPVNRPIVNSPQSPSEDAISSCRHPDRNRQEGWDVDSLACVSSGGRGSRAPRPSRHPGVSASVRQARADPPPALFIYRTTRKHSFRLCLMCPRFGGFGLQGSDFVDNDEITQTISV